MSSDFIGFHWYINRPVSKYFLLIIILNSELNEKVVEYRKKKINNFNLNYVDTQFF